MSIPDDYADTLAAVLGQAEDIVDRLAAELAEIQDALEQEAYTASRYGVKIGIDGRPPPVLAGPPADAAAMSERHWTLAYQQAFERAMVAARQANQRAASQLMDLSARIGGPAGHSPSGDGGSREGRVQERDDRGRQAGRGDDVMVRAATNSSGS